MLVRLPPTSRLISTFLVASAALSSRSGVFCKTTPAHHLHTQTKLLRSYAKSNHFLPTSRLSICPVRSFALFANMSDLKAPTPPQAPHSFDYTPEAIKDITSKAIERTRKLEDGIAALKPEDCTFETVVLPLALDEARFDTGTDSACFMQSVSTDKLVRDAATEATMKISDFSIESSMRKDIYEALKNVQQNTPANSLDPESARLLERMLRDKRRAGLALPDDKQARFKELKTKISNKCIEFRKNCDEENGFLLFTKDELDGVPLDVIKGYPEEEDNNVIRHKVTFKTPDIVPLLRYANNSETRRRGYLGYEDRSAGPNTQLFKEIMQLRVEAAEIIGYDTWADYVIEPKMAKTAQAAKDFLNDLYDKIKPIGEKEKDKLMALKKEHCAEQGVPYDDVFYAWDYRFYDRLWTERNLQLDDEKVKEYLPVEHVVPKMMELYEKLLGVQCFPLKDASTWHKEVTAFSVWDKEALEKGEKGDAGFIGFFYLDPYPRPNKYGHAACWGLIPGFEQPDGSRNYPTSAVVANLAKATEDKPALLSHNDFVTLFHEQGHAWHGLLSKTKYARFHGTAVVRDFVEAPSQMLENWCYEPEVLRYMTSHYKTGEAMPDDLIDKIVKAEAVNQGLFTLRQLYFGLFDLHVHTAKDAIDYTKTWNDLREKIALTSIGNAPLGQGQSSFAHLIGGYDAGYYGYLWSQSFSADMYATVFKADPMSAKQGMLYRKEILQPGGSREEMESLTAFLGGRPPNSDAFMKKLLRGAESF